MLQKVKMSGDFLFFAKPDDTEKLTRIFDIISNSSSERINQAISKNQETINELLLKLLVSYKYKSIDKGNTLSSSNEDFNPRNTLETLTNTKFPEISNNLHVATLSAEKSYFDLISNDSCQHIISFLSESDIYVNHRYPLHCVSKQFNKLMQETESRRAKYFDEDYYYTISDLYKSFKKHEINRKSTTDEFKCAMTLPNGLIENGLLKEFSYPLDSQKEINYACTGSRDFNTGINDSSNDKRLKFTTTTKRGEELHEFSFGSNNLLFYQNVRLLDVFSSKDWNGNININSNNINDFKKKEFEIDKQTRTMFTKYNKLQKRIMIHNKNMYQHSLESKSNSKSNLNSNKSILCLNSLYGNNIMKLVDVNLRALINYYIYEKTYYNILGGLSIAEMAYYFSKRKWIVGIVYCNVVPNLSYIYTDNIYENNFTKSGMQQLKIEIDISPEILQISKHLENTDSNSNSDQIQELDTMIQNVNHDHTNVSTSITSVGDRYTLSFYCFADNTRIMNKFGTNTTKVEQSQLWNSTTFGMHSSFDNPNYQCFYPFKPIKKFKQIVMYSKWIGKGNYDISQALKTLGYLFVDCRFFNGGAWSCGILMKKSDIDRDVKVQDENLHYYNFSNYDKVRIINDEEMKEYVYFTGGAGREETEKEKEEEDDDDEITNHIGLVGVINYDENKMIDLHLDSKKRIDYFGQHTSKEQQLNILNQVFKFENINQNSKNKLIEWQNNQKEKELAKKKQREEAEAAAAQEATQEVTDYMPRVRKKERKQMPATQAVQQYQDTHPNTSSGGDKQSGKMRRWFSKKK